MTDLSSGLLSPSESYYEVPSEDAIISDVTFEVTTKRLAKTIVGAPLHITKAFDVVVDDARDALLKSFSKATLKDRYLTEDETFQDRFANCVRYYANDQEHAQRMYDYISKLWCMPSTPILSNGGTRKGNLISCFVNDAEDSMEGIVKTWNENIWIGAGGGGIGSYFGGVRGIGEKIQRNGKTSGAISFIQVVNALVGCINQGSNRRGAGAVYLDIHHPEIDAFLDLRRQAGGDPDRKALNLHHGVVIDDKFMNAVMNNETYDLISPHTGEVTETIVARELAAKLVTTRLETGEPYILFKDNINRRVPEHHKKSGLYPKTSNLCSEIVLPTGKDHRGIDRTAICCLFQPNAEKFDEWKHDPHFFKDIAYFLDNVLQDFIDHAGDHFISARYSASRERSIGVGMMGFHSFLQARSIPMEGVMAKVWNKKIFGHLQKEMAKASRELAEERGACPDAAEHGVMERFSYKTAIAPTASTSVICGGTSASIDAIPANIYTHKTLDGSFEVKNPYLEKILAERGFDTQEIWDSISEKGGSVQHLDCLDEHEKLVYKTSFEIDQRVLVELNADRTPMIDQSQSLNLAMPPNVWKRDLWKIHEMAWKLGVKSMYYLRSYSVQTVDNGDGSFSEDTSTYQHVDYDQCLSCQ